MKNLLTLAAASLIGMAGVTASASMVARNIETAAKKIIWKQTKYFKRFPNPHKQPSRPRRSGFRLSTDSGIRYRHKREPQTAKFGGGNKRKRDDHEKLN